MQNEIKATELREYIKELAQRYITWRDNLHKEMRGDKLMFNVPNHYKWLDEKELFVYYIDFIQELTKKDK